MVNDKEKEKEKAEAEDLLEELSPTSFHSANLKRRMRCITIFIMMAAAFVVITIININSGNVHIGVGEIAKATFGESAASATAAARRPPTVPNTNPKA